MYKHTALVLVVLVLLAAVPAAAEAVVVADPGYLAGDLGFEAGISYLVPGGIALDVTWNASDRFMVTLNMEAEDGVFTYGDLGGANFFGPFWVEYGLSRFSGDSFLRAGSGLVLSGETLSVVLIGNVLYGREQAIGGVRGGLGWSPWPDSFILAGLYTDVDYVFSTGISTYTPPTLYLYGRADAKLGSFALGASTTIIRQLDYDVDLYALYDAWDWGGIGAMVAFNAGPTGQDWTMQYGMTLRARI